MSSQNMIFDIVLFYFRTGWIWMWPRRTVQCHSHSRDKPRQLYLWYHGNFLKNEYFPDLLKTELSYQIFKLTKNCSDLSLFEQIVLVISKFLQIFFSITRTFFSNFSCRFLNPNNFFQFELLLFYFLRSEKSPGTS